MLYKLFKTKVIDPEAITFVQFYIFLDLFCRKENKKGSREKLKRPKLKNKN